MLNGKFYTGLPPKMEERQSGGGRNRQESHFFWPDDTRVDSAVETRVRRRNSVQLDSGVGNTERPRLTQAQRQSDSTPDVDTRQMFHKEFAKSSIQFTDNLQPSDSHQSSRLLNRTRREVTPKLTDIITQPRPMSTISTIAETDPSAARRKQAYSSKIEFYDYVNDAGSTQNNVRRPKMDMNNKREVELNSKNSPKLQVKHNVRHLSVDREQLQPTVQMVTKKPLNDGQNWEQEQYEQVKRPMTPKKILKQQRNQPWIEVNNESMLDYVDNGVRLLRLRSPASSKKHVTYNEEAAEYAYYDDRLEPTEGRQLRQSQPNMHTGSAQQHEQQHQHQHQQQRAAPYVETGRDRKTLNNYNINSRNNYNDNYNNNNYNSNNSSHSLRSKKILPKLPELAATRTMRARSVDDTRAPAETSVAEQLSPSDPRKHLRSSLCFNGDALVVDVGAAAQSTSAAALARRSAAGRRITVGLPD